MKKISLISFTILFLCFIYVFIYNNKKYPTMLNILIKDDYYLEDYFKDFEIKNNIKINVDYYSNDYDAYNKAKSNNYDIAIVSDVILLGLKNSNVIKNISKTRISNIRNIDDKYNDNYDYAVDYTLNNIVFSENGEDVKDERIILGSCLLLNDFDPNTLNEKSLEIAYNTCKSLDKQIIWQNTAVKNNYKYDFNNNYIKRKDYIVMIKESDNAYFLINDLLNAENYANMINTSGYTSLNWTYKYYGNNNVNNYDNGHNIKMVYDDKFLYNKYYNMLNK